MRRRIHKEQKAAHYLKKIIEERVCNERMRFYCYNPDHVKRIKYHRE